MMTRADYLRIAAEDAGYRQRTDDGGEEIPGRYAVGPGSLAFDGDGWYSVAGRDWALSFDDETPMAVIVAALEEAAWPGQARERILARLVASLTTQTEAHGVVATKEQIEAIARNLAQWVQP